MDKDNILKFDEKGLFNSNLLQQYDEHGQKGFLGYLLRYKNWKIDENKIIFPDIKSNEKIQELLIEYDKDTKKNYINIQNVTLEKVSIYGLTQCQEMLKKEIYNIDNCKWKEISNIQRENRTKDRQKLNKNIR